MKRQIEPLVKECAMKNKHGMSYVDADDIVRTGISMGVVKVDSCVPDWDVEAVQYGREVEE